MPDRLSIMLVGESDLRIGESDPMKIVMNVRTLCLRRSEEFAPSGQIVKNVPNLDARSHSTRSRPHINHLASVNENSSALRIGAIAFFRGQTEAADAGNARQRFPAKSHASNRIQIRCFTNLAGSVSF